MKVYPLKFEPIFKERIWGGQKLREVFGKNLPEGKKVGESWELADLADDKCLIENGDFASETLGSVIERYPEEITGDKNFSLPFPLLIKFLDAEEVLSVQVHPDAWACERMGKGEPKTECWYIISADEGAVIYKGLKDGVTREVFAEAIEGGNVEELLVKAAVRAGECHLLPAGTTHAIGGGLLIAEIQTPSDTTYRVFDWNRVDDSGQSRQLHIEEALESIHFDSSGDNLSVREMGCLADCEYFRIDKGHQAERCEVLFSKGQMKVLVFLSGCGAFQSGSGGCVEFRAGDTILVPAGYEGAIKNAADTQYLTLTIQG